MEYHGCTLSSITGIEQAEPVTILKLILALVDRLEKLHDRGFCHGDIKLQNMLRSDNNALYLIDYN